MQGLADDKGKQMATVRIERMMRELHAEPPLRFFEWMFDLLGLGRGDEVALRPMPVEVQKPA